MYLHERVLREALNTIYMPTTPTFSSPAPSWLPALACMPTTSPRPPFACLIPLVRCVQLWGMSIRELSLQNRWALDQSSAMKLLAPGNPHLACRMQAPEAAGADRPSCCWSLRDPAMYVLLPSSPTPRTPPVLSCCQSFSKPGSLPLLQFPEISPVASEFFFSIQN